MSETSVCDRLIAVDWGTTNFRAWLLDASGSTLDAIDAPRGVSHVSGDDLAASFRTLLAPWLQEVPGAPVVMAGMIGSVDGLVEAPYLPCPVALDDIASGMVPVADLDNGRTVLIVPGLSVVSRDGSHDVMRGEEVQIIGALEQDGAGDVQVLCVPGTHSKWVSVQDRCVTGFSTSLTGDAYAALREHTLLSRTIATGPHDDDAFVRGLDRATRPGGLLYHLFSVRTESLLGDLSPQSAGAYLSGVLIGNEVSAMLEAFAPGGCVTVIGGPSLIGLYSRAIRYFGCDVRCIDGGEASRRGLHKLFTLAVRTEG